MDFEALINFIEEAGYDARSYSGRGMYGRECVGVTCDNELSFVADLFQTCSNMNEVGELAYLIGNARTDSMGRSRIMYFPSVEWEEVEEEEEIED